MAEATVGSGVCQVRSGTDDPCLEPATVLLLGVPFCEQHAREQERYFEIGDLTGERTRFRVGDLGEPRGLSGVLRRLNTSWRGQPRAGRRERRV